MAGLLVAFKIFTILLDVVFFFIPYKATHLKEPPLKRITRSEPLSNEIARIFSKGMEVVGHIKKGEYMMHEQQLFQVHYAYA